MHPAVLSRKWHLSSKKDMLLTQTNLYLFEILSTGSRCRYRISLSFDRPAEGWLCKTVLPLSAGNEERDDRVVLRGIVGLLVAQPVKVFFPELHWQV